ncbi:MAG: OmpA family protein [Pseudomonadota bacterium]
MGKQKDSTSGFGQSRRAGLKLSRASRVRKTQSEQGGFSIVWLLVLPPVVALASAAVFLNFEGNETAGATPRVSGPVERTQDNMSDVNVAAGQEAAVVPAASASLEPKSLLPKLSSETKYDQGFSVMTDIPLLAATPSDLAKAQLDAPVPTLSDPIPAANTVPVVIEQSCVDSLRENLSPTVFYFERGAISLDETDTRRMITSLRQISECPEAFVEVGGHSDKVGEFGFNVELSWKRAETALLLAGENGLDTDRIEVIGYGDRRMVSEGETEADHALNRRIELTIR